MHPDDHQYGYLRGNVYMVDNEKYLGSWGQGESELHTLAIPGQVVCWRIEPITPTERVSIVQFDGPWSRKKYASHPDRVWWTNRSGWDAPREHSEDMNTG